MQRFTTLDEYLDACWRLLLNGATKKNDPLRLPVLGTGEENRAHLRIVVLRKVDVAPRRLIFYTDIRSAKVTHLQQHPQLTSLFYHPKKQIQIRTEGTVHVHHQDELATLHWNALPIPLRKPYATLQLPGSVVHHGTDGVPDRWKNDITHSETEYAFAHFAVLVCEVKQLEALLLHADGHQRAQFTWTNEQWEGNWLIP